MKKQTIIISLLAIGLITATGNQSEAKEKKEDKKAKEITVEEYVETAREYTDDKIDNDIYSKLHKFYNLNKSDNNKNIKREFDKSKSDYNEISKRIDEQKNLNVDDIFSYVKEDYNDYIELRIKEKEPEYNVEKKEDNSLKNNSESKLNESTIQYILISVISIFCVFLIFASLKKYKQISKIRKEKKNEKN